MPIGLLWTDLTSQDQIDELIKRFADFKDAYLSDIKFFSANLNSILPEDVSDESACYVKFSSKNPSIAADTDANEIVLKFTGVSEVIINTAKFDYGKIKKFELKYENDHEVRLKATSSEDGIKPTELKAETVAWAYDLGDDLR